MDAPYLKAMFHGNHPYHLVSWIASLHGPHFLVVACYRLITLEENSTNFFIQLIAVDYKEAIGIPHQENLLEDNIVPHLLQHNLRSISPMLPGVPTRMSLRTIILEYLWMNLLSMFTPLKKDSHSVGLEEPHIPSWLAPSSHS